MPGPVRATSILCLLGIGLGLGSVLIYRLCRNIFTPAIPGASPPPRTKKRRPSTPGVNQSLPEQTSADKLSPDTPDSGIQAGPSRVNSTVVTPDSPSSALPSAHGVYPLRSSQSEDASSSSGLRYRGSLRDVDLESDWSAESHPGSYGATADDRSRYCNARAKRDHFSSHVSCDDIVDGRFRAASGGGGAHRSVLSNSCISSDQGFVSGNITGSLPDGCIRNSSLSLSQDQVSVGGHSLPAGFCPGRRSDPSAHDHQDGRYPLERDGYASRQMRQQCKTPRDKLETYSEDQSYASFDLGSEPGASHSTPQSQEFGASPAGYHEAKLYSSFPRDKRESQYPRRAHSIASDVSASTDYSFADSRASRGYSFDQDTFSDISTAVSEVEENSDIGCGTTSSLDVIQNELRLIRMDIDEMNDKVQDMHLSRENLLEILTLTPNVLPQDDASPTQTYRVVRRHRSNRKLSLSRSRSVSVERDMDRERSFRRRGNHCGDYMWDYQSDLAMDDSQLHFVANRPVFGDSTKGLDESVRSVSQSPTLEHVKKYWEQSFGPKQLDSPGNDTNGNVTPGGKKRMSHSLTFNSICDMYIDDDFSGQMDTFSEFDQRRLGDGSYGNTPHEPSVLPSRECQSNSQHEASLHWDKQTLCNINNAKASGSREASDERSLCLECGSQAMQAKRDCPTGAPECSLAGGGSAATQASSRRSPCPNCGHGTDHSPSPGAGRGGMPARVSFWKGRLGKSGLTKQKWEVKNVREKVNLFEYAEKEWKGGTLKAQTMKKGYHRICSLLEMTQLRPIRGDNYCALRSTLYQVFVNNHPILQHFGSKQRTLKKLEVFQDPKYSFLQNWSFANRLPYAKETVYHQVCDCVASIYDLMGACKQLGGTQPREDHLLALLNCNPEVDLQLMESIKVLMMVKAIDLFEDYSTGNTTPVFAWLMFARDSSETPEALFKNHINPVGDISGIEQKNLKPKISEEVEMFLLGHTLGVKIEVVRPSRYGQGDFISHYPDEGADNFPKVYLVAEDDRHYNVILP